MTYRPILSERIADLEAQTLHLDDLSERIADLEAELSRLRSEEYAALAARHQLDLITAHVERVLDGHAVTPERPAVMELPETHEVGVEDTVEGVTPPDDVHVEPALLPALEVPEEPVSLPDVAPPVQEPAPVTATFNAPSTPDAALVEALPNAFERVSTWVDALGDRQVTASDAASELDLGYSTAGRCLSQLERQGTLLSVAGTGVVGNPRRYYLPGFFLPTTVAPVAPHKPQAQQRTEPVRPPSQVLAGMVPIPDGLNTDERSMFDAVRREVEGLSTGVLAGRLNWSRTRVNRAVGRLIEDGHFGRRGDRLVAVPQELSGAAS